MFVFMKVFYNFKVKIKQERNGKMSFILYNWKAQDNLKKSYYDNKRIFIGLL